MKPRGITSKHARPVVGALVALLAAVVVVGMVVVMAQTYALTASIREAQKTNTGTASTTATTLELIEDCLSVDGYCADARETADKKQAVALTRISVFASACADQPARQTAKEIETCVKALLDQSGAR